MTTENKGPRIYVASLSDYNNGELHGRWIDADQDPDQIAAEVQSMLAQSSRPGAEEWAIHDYEGFGGVRLREWESWQRVAAIARMVVEHGPAFAVWLGSGWADGLDPDEWADRFSDEYHGEWESPRDYAEAEADSLGWYMLLENHGIPAAYLDLDAFVRDLDCGGAWFADAPGGGVYVFEQQ